MNSHAVDLDGVSGASRPAPTAQDNEAPAPQVSHNAPNGAPGEELPAMASADVKNRPEQGGAAAKPGFSLN